MTTLPEKAIKTFAEWFKSLPTYKNTGGLPAKGSVTAALVVLEHLKSSYELDLKDHQAGGRAQLKGLNPNAVRKILADFGETRPFASEAGRTNRGGPGAVEKMLETLRTMDLEKLAIGIRNQILHDFQRFLVEKIREYHNLKRLEFIYDATRTTSSIIHDLLTEAARVGKAGPVAQYLVGAKLQLRFSDRAISNERYSAPDSQSGRLGDFEIGDTVFHVTVSPMPVLYEKCKRNIDAGSRVFILVPDICLAGTRQNAETVEPAKIAVESLESFIANNIEEISQFSKPSLTSGFRRLLDMYNQRVGAIELDKSMLIQIPRNLT